MARKDEVLTLEELAEYLKLSKSTVYKLVGEGKIPGQKVGRNWRFRKAVINIWLGDTSARSTTKQSILEHGAQTCLD